MQQLLENHIFTGMQKDLSVSKHPVQFLYDARNIRLTAREKDTLLSVTNERSTLDTNITINGTYLGHCLLGKYLVVFSTKGLKEDDNASEEDKAVDDYITRIDLSTKEKLVLYNGNLSFSLDHPIEAIGSYENESIQKVYWIDGDNQLRMINIVAEKLLSGELDDTKSYYDATNLGYTDYSFDSIPVLQLNEEITVSRMLGSSGEFTSGVIQYAFTYYRKYGQETNIFYTSPLRFIAPIDRGGAPDEKVSTSFEIKVTNVDRNFDFLRIYSIQRTSLDGTPICKRVVDIEIKGLTNDTATYIDTGTNGDSIDPVELLYKGGEEVVAKAITQKDNTLFLGNLTLRRPSLIEELGEEYYDSDTHKLKADVADVKVDTDNLNTVSSARPITFDNNTYAYFNQLSGKNSSGEIGVPCAGFKEGDTYRCGVQFQYKDGTWSNPFFIKDLKATKTPSLTSSSLDYPRFEGSISAELTSFLKGKDYVKARAVIVYPEVQDRATICQGVLCPTLYTTNHRQVDKDLLAQSSWFFRPQKGTSESYMENMKNKVTASPWSKEGRIPYTEIKDSYDPELSYNEVAANIRQVEIQGFFENDDRFMVDWGLVTMHSPDIEFDSQLHNTNFNNTSCFHVGKTTFSFTMSDIDIQTSTPTVSNSGDGFIHRSFNSEKSKGIVSGLFYDDYAVDDLSATSMGKWSAERSPFKWMVYLWQRSGALNNDMNRPTNMGNTSSLLKKKVISNLRYGDTTFFSSTPEPGNFGDKIPELFSSDETTIIKVTYDSNYPAVYQGNVDTILNSKLQGKFFAFDGTAITSSYMETSIDSTNWWKLYGEYRNGEGQTLDVKGIYHFDSNNITWGNPVNTSIGGAYSELVVTKDLIRMKYKSTPHLVFRTPIDFTTPDSGFSLPVVDIRRNTIDTPFGGTSLDALKANLWIPCGKAVKLGNKKNENDEEFTKFNYNYGDTYYQRWDCLKTYPFTHEDENQIVEIGSFPLQTHTNIDGRYDRNRGQSSNLNMSPQNFNLLNPVYSQRDNFFTYRILDDDYYKINSFPSQITWSKEKQAGADIDLWTNITLGSTYDMDGSKGDIISLNTWKDQIFCFQEKGISNILFNSRVQIPTSDGVPIEITNSYKVDGYRYISDGIGCKDKFLIKETPAGIYFIDSISNHLLRIGNESLDLSSTLNMSSWFKNKGNMQRLVYDEINHDVYVICKDEALCYSEPLQQFTSFMNYENISLLEGYNKKVFSLKNSILYQLFAGTGYCQLFGENKPWSITFVSNGSDQNLVAMDKTFTNLEFRATVEEEGLFDGDESEKEFKSPFLPVDKVETWNEFQHGIAALDLRNGHVSMQHHNTDNSASLKKKFRIWRCDIPRDNAVLPDSLGLARYKKRPLDRMRNLWLYVKLQKDAADTEEVLNHTELHDMMVKYYI